MAVILLRTCHVKCHQPLSSCWSSTDRCQSVWQLRHVTNAQVGGGVHVVWSEEMRLRHRNVPPPEAVREATSSRTARLSTSLFAGGGPASVYICFADSAASAAASASVVFAFPCGITMVGWEKTVTPYSRSRFNRESLRYWTCSIQSNGDSAQPC
jgi:hypothetical protein